MPVRTRTRLSPLEVSISIGIHLFLRACAQGSDCPCLVDGGQGNGAGGESGGVDPVPPLQQGFAEHLAEGLWAERQSGLIDRSRYAVAAAPVVELAAATMSQTLPLE